ncbi:MAG: Abi-alpha family protein [Acidimicrobiales bacterium]
MSDEPLPIPSLRDREVLQAALPGLARVAVSSAWRLASWAVTTTVDTNAKILKAVADGESPATAVQEAITEWRDIARKGLGLDLNEVPVAQQPHSRPGATLDELRARGAELLHDAADVWYEGDTHPAYARILEELSPDEARILRFLAVEGPQPSIDVRTSRPLGVGSELVAGGLSMVGLHAGVRNIERTHADLDNLYRLGLVWFSREQVADPSRYQVVEVQPDVDEAKKKAGRSHKTVHRSIHLTTFGEDFCKLCLPGAERPPAAD